MCGEAPPGQNEKGQNRHFFQSGLFQYKLSGSKRDDFRGISSFENSILNFKNLSSKFNKIQD